MTENTEKTKWFILSAIHDHGAANAVEIYNAVGKKAGLTVSQIASYLRVLKSHDEVVYGGENGARWQLTDAGLDFLSTIMTDFSAYQESERIGARAAACFAPFEASGLVESPADFALEPYVDAPDVDRRDSDLELLVMDELSRSMDALTDQAAAKGRVIYWFICKYAE